MMKKQMKINSEGHLEFSGCDLVELAGKYGTPLYIMNEMEIRRRCRSYRSILHDFEVEGKIFYAAKAFLTVDMCRLVKEESLGLDVVSGGELYTALKAGFPPEDISFNGNNKTPDEIELALDADIGRFVVDSFDELKLLDKMAKERDKHPKVLLRLTPGIEAHTHKYIKTGHEDSKFGMNIADGAADNAVKIAMNLNNIVLKGIHCHIGSQIFNMDSYRAALEIMLNFVKETKEKYNFICEELNLGGGVGIKYIEDDSEVDLDEYGQIISETLHEKCKALEIEIPYLYLEPGRSIVGPAGITLYRVGVVKHLKSSGKKYAIVDGGMTDNIRPALYNARYEAAAANKADRKNSEVVTIAGRCCESGDILIEDIDLPELEVGDLIAVFSTGAYNYSMASNYNMLRRPPVLLVSQGRVRVSVKRQKYSDFLRNDIYFHSDDNNLQLSKDNVNIS